MDATCNVQDSIHVFHLVHNMCPGFWVHITQDIGLCFNTKHKILYFLEMFNLIFPYILGILLEFQK